jgi:hypothetical protein
MVGSLTTMIEHILMAALQTKDRKESQHVPTPRSLVTFIRIANCSRQTKCFSISITKYIIYVQNVQFFFAIHMAGTRPASFLRSLL